MKSILPSLLWIAIITLCACETVPEKPWTNCNVSGKVVTPLAISYRDTINLHLDEMMVLGSTSSVDYHAKQNLLYAFDANNKRVVEYKLGGKGLIYPDSTHAIKISPRISYMKYVSRDTVILYTYGWNAALFYYSLDRDTVYKSYPFVRKETVSMKIPAGPPYPTAATPIFFNGNRAIGAGMMIGEKENESIKQRTIFTEINLSTGNINNRQSYPKVYWEHNWGGVHMRAPYTTYNERTKNLVLSLPADHNIQVIDSNWQTKEIYAGSRKEVCIAATTLSKEDEKMMDAEAILGYYTGTPSYRSIIYDQYHDRYYRLVEFPPVPLQSYLGTFKSKDVGLIAFDKDFNYLGEAMLGPGLALENFFITKDGLYFLNVDNKNNDLAQYVQCKVEL